MGLPAFVFFAVSSVTFVFVVLAPQFTFRRRLCSILPLVSDVEVCTSPLDGVSVLLCFFFCSLPDAGCARTSHWLAAVEVCASPFVSCSFFVSVRVES